jgi:hypothetical protein
MNTGQVMMVLGAFTLLSVLVLNVNGMITGTMQTSLEMQATLNAVSIAQSMMDEILKREFDEASINTRIYNTNDMTPTAGLGPNLGETIFGIDSTFQSKSKFDDVDDYHNYRRKVKDSHLGWYYVTNSVEYVNETEPDQKIWSQTFVKRITITVANQYMLKKKNSNEVQPVVLKELAVYRRYF